MLTLFTWFLFNNLEWCKKLTLKSDCDYKLPANYKLVKSIGTGNYAILFEGKSFLMYKFSDNEITDTNLAEYVTTFEDSCKAKAFCKQHFQQLLQFKFE